MLPLHDQNWIKGRERWGATLDTSFTGVENNNRQCQGPISLADEQSGKMQAQDAGVQGEKALYPATMLQGVYICGCILACCRHSLYSLRNNIAELR